MKKIIIVLVLVAVAAWALQTYTDYKVIDYAKNYASRLNWEDVKKFKFPAINWMNLKTPSADKQLNVFIRDGQFVPNSNAMPKGIRVVWINEDNKAHTVTGEGWGSPEIQPGKSWSRSFDVAGEYSYSCSVHPSMTGELIVE